MLGKTIFIKSILALLTLLAFMAVFGTGNARAQAVATTEYTLEQALTQEERGVLSLSQALALADP